jgi:periplasmic protein CpxP/Spy
MSKIQSMIWVTLLGASMIAPVYAEEALPAGGMSRAHPDPVAMVDKRLARFKGELRITSDQESAWTAYAEKTRSNVKDMRDQMQAAMKDPAQTAPERFDRHIELMKKRLVSFQNMDDALKSLYAALTPEQKSIADRHFARMRH